MATRCAPRAGAGQGVLGSATGRTATAKAKDQREGVVGSSLAAVAKAASSVKTAEAGAMAALVPAPSKGAGQPAEGIRLGPLPKAIIRDTPSTATVPLPEGVRRATIAHVPDRPSAKGLARWVAAALTGALAPAQTSRAPTLTSATAVTQVAAARVTTDTDSAAVRLMPVRAAVDPNMAVRAPALCPARSRATLPTE